MRKAADLYPEQTKTDARDAFIIAGTARTMPHTLRSVDRESDVLANLKLLADTDEDLAHDITLAINRLRSLLVQIHPALERVFKGTMLARSIVLDLLARYRGPAGLRAAGKSGVKRWARNQTRKDPSSLIDTIFDALAEQTATVPGSQASESVVPRHAVRMKALKAERTEIETDAEELADALPLLQVFTSIPGVAVKTATQILLAACDFSAIKTAAHLAAYGGIAPVTRRSGASIRDEFPSRAANKRLKNASFHTAWVASCRDSVSKAYYERKRDEGKRDNAAVMCLARCRLSVLFAMVRAGVFYEVKTPAAARQ